MNNFEFKTFKFQIPFRKVPTQDLYGVSKLSKKKKGELAQIILFAAHFSLLNNNWA